MTYAKRFCEHFETQSAQEFGKEVLAYIRCEQCRHLISYSHVFSQQIIWLKMFSTLSIFPSYVIFSCVLSSTLLSPLTYLQTFSMLPWSVISNFRCLGFCCKCRWWRRAKTCPWSKWREDEGSSRCKGERGCPSLQVIILLKYILMIHFFCHPGNVRGVVLGFRATTQFAVRLRRCTSSLSWSKFGAHTELPTSGLATSSQFWDWQSWGFPCGLQSPLHFNIW